MQVLPGIGSNPIPSFRVTSVSVIALWLVPSQR
jgi:hypothetical protein